MMNEIHYCKKALLFQPAFHFSSFQGIRRRRMTCIRKSDHVVVSDQRCEHIPPVPDVSEECNTECELR